MAATAHLYQIIILAFIQGMAELLPVSSSAHVIVAEKLMGINPIDPQMTFLLVMLHTGTMFAVLIYFWKRWLKLWNQSAEARVLLIKTLVIATAATGFVGLALMELIEKVFLSNIPHAQVEDIFGNLTLISISLAVVGIFIFISGSMREKNGNLNNKNSLWIGIIQGLCLPFRGFSRSGATISTGLATGVSRSLAEEFSFALAVILTPPVIARELWRLRKAHALAHIPLTHLVMPGIIGMVFSFIAGLFALWWLSNWIESGRWKWFSYYCIVAAITVFSLHHFLHL